MKKILELLVCFLHPVAVVLVWLNVVVRPDLSRNAKLVWALLALVPVVPFVYVLTGGELWETSDSRASGDASRRSATAARPNRIA